MKIGFVTVDWATPKNAEGERTAGGAGWYRMVMPAQFLARNGVDTVVGYDLLQTIDGDFHIKTFDDEIHKDFDIIVMQRWMAAEAEAHIKHARSTGQIVIQDIDDHFSALDPQNRAFITTHPRFDPGANRNHYRRAIMASSAITTSTAFLARHYEGTGKPVHVLENCIDLERWPQRNVSGPVEVGWVGAVGYRSGDFDVLRGRLGPWLRKHSGHFHHSGYWEALPHAGDLLALSADISRSESPLVGIDQYPQVFGAFTIGIVPLADKAFNEAKSHIKGLEYAASGIPFVASNTGEYRRFVSRLGYGAVASRYRDWLRELEKLADERYRVEQGQGAREAAEQWNMTHRWTQWQQTYSQIQKEIR